MQENENTSKEELNIKLVKNLRNVGHILHGFSEGKGSQKRILTILNENNSITQSELTKKIGIKSGSASEVIQKLEKNGYITRTPSPNDNRTMNIELTDSGKSEAEKATIQKKQLYNEMFVSLNDEEQKTLLTLLEKLNKDWSSRYLASQLNCHHHRRHHHENGGK